ncbi:MAG: HDOD domain-containing protein [Bryobacteraceae bacterium]|nr:HDOD domain-containing protein [Bryobacteraceae bacterium]
MSTAHAGLDHFLDEMADASDFPALASSIQQVMNTAEKEDAFQTLTNIILRDLSLTLRVLRTANSAYYNRSGNPILSVSHAIAMLGTDTVRQVVSSVALLEHFQRKSPGLRELILLALLTANHAREIALRLGFRSREEAYLCGMLRNLGEVLMACYRPRDYAGILIRISQQKIPQAQVCREVAGFTYEELARAVISRWKMPSSVIACIGEVEPLLLRRYQRGSADYLLPQITCFAHRLTQAIYRRDENVTRASLNLVVDRFGRPLGIGPEEVRGILEAALEETRGTFALMNVPLDHLRLRQQEQSARGLLGPDSSLAAPESPRETLARLVREVEHLAAAEPENVTGLLLIVLEAIYRGGPFDRVLFAVADTAGGTLQARTGFGAGVEEAIATFRFPMAAAPFGLSLDRQQDIYSSGIEGRWDSSPLVRALRPAVFGLLPLCLPSGPAGCIYFDRDELGPPVDSVTLASFSALRDRLAHSLRPGRSVPFRG